METGESNSVSPAASPAAKSSALTQRLISGLILAPLTLILILFNQWTFMALVVVLLAISFYEWYRMAAVTSRPTRNLCIGAAYLLICFVAFIFLRLGFMQGKWLATAILFAVWASDTGAYVIGKMVGGAKLCPKISPNKTWAGFIGAMLSCGLMLMALAGLGHYLEPYLPTDIGLKPKHVWYVFFIGCFLGAVGQAGDLAVSWFKRRAGVKDTGDIIPGHGGLLDRIDSSLLVCPIFLFIIMAWCG